MDTNTRQLIKNSPYFKRFITGLAVHDLKVVICELAPYGRNKKPYIEAYRVADAGNVINYLDILIEEGKVKSSDVQNVLLSLIDSADFCLLALHYIYNLGCKRQKSLHYFLQLDGISLITKFNQKKFSWNRDIDRQNFHWLLKIWAKSSVTPASNLIRDPERRDDL